MNWKICLAHLLLNITCRGKSEKKTLNLIYYDNNFFLSRLFLLITLCTKVPTQIIYTLRFPFLRREQKSINFQSKFHPFRQTNPPQNVDSIYRGKVRKSRWRKFIAITRRSPTATARITQPGAITSLIPGELF